MANISYSGYRFPPAIIQQAIWLYLRFTLSFRDVEDLLAERGIAVSYETVRRWVNHFGPKIAANLRKRRPKPHTTWHLDEVYLKIDGHLVYLWRAVDSEGEVLEVLVQAKRNKQSALKLMRKLLKRYGFIPERLITDDLRSYGAAILASRIDINVVAAATIARRIRISRHDDESERCRASRAGVSPEISLRSRRHLQHVQCSTPSHFSEDPPSFSLGRYPSGCVGEHRSLAARQWQMPLGPEHEKIRALMRSGHPSNAIDGVFLPLIVAA